MSSLQPLRISEFVIKGFKCIPNWYNETILQIPMGEELFDINAKNIYQFMDLGNFIVITGNNASGKSTFLQALFLVLGSGLKKLDTYVNENEIVNKNIIVDLASKYMGLRSVEDLKYLFHRVKLPRRSIDYASDEISIRLTLSAETDVTLELHIRNKKDNIEVNIEGVNSLEEFTPRINDIYVFHPIYPGNIQHHSGVFSARGLGEIDIPIEMSIRENEDISNTFSINYIYKLTEIIGEDKKLPFPRIPIQFVPLGAYIKSRLKLVRTIERIKRNIHNIYDVDLSNIFIFEEPEIGLHPILQKEFVREIYREFFYENNTKEHMERNIVIIVTQSNHILNESIRLALEKKDNKYFIPTFIDCCQKIVKIKQQNKLTISCMYQKFYPDYMGKERVIPYDNYIRRTSEISRHNNICFPHSFYKALLRIQNKS